MFQRRKGSRGRNLAMGRSSACTVERSFATGVSREGDRGIIEDAAEMWGFSSTAAWLFWVPAATDEAIIYLLMHATEWKFFMWVCEQVDRSLEMM